MAKRRDKREAPGPARPAWLRDSWAAPWPTLCADRGGRVLETVALVYAAVPTLLWLWGWVRWYYALPLAVALIYALWPRAWARPGASPDEAHTPRARIGPLEIALTALAACAIIAVSGIGGFSFQFRDVVFYDTVLKDVIALPWPSGYVNAETPDMAPEIMTYYFGWWLVAGLAGKLFGWYAAQFTLALYSAIGLTLTLLLFRRLVGWRPGLPQALFLLFGGLDLLRSLIGVSTPAGSPTPVLDFFTGTYGWTYHRGWLDQWHMAYSYGAGAETLQGVFWKLYSPLSFFVVGPYHAFPCYLIILLMAHDLLVRRHVGRLGALWALNPICSVFVGMMSAPFVVAAALAMRMRGAFTPGNMLVAPVFVLLFLAYYTSFRDGPGFQSGWLWTFVDLSEVWPGLLAFYLFEFGLLVLVCPHIVPRDPALRVWFFVALATFLFAPWYRMGVFNDFTYKSTIPGLIVLLLAVGRALATAPENEEQRWRYRATLAMLAIGALVPLGIVLRGLSFGIAFDPNTETQVRSYSRAIPDETIDIGLADSLSVFWRYIAPPLREVQTVPEIPVVYEVDLVNGRIVGLPDATLYFAPGVEMTEAGLRVPPGFSGMAIELQDIALDSARVGHMQPTWDYACGPVDLSPAVTARWDTRPGVREPFAEYPRWHNHRIVPEWQPVIANSNWRGTIHRIGLSIDTPPLEDTCALQLRSLRLLAR